MRGATFVILAAVVLSGASSCVQHPGEVKQRLSTGSSGDASGRSDAVSRERAFELAREVGFQKGLGQWVAELRLDASFGHVWEIRNVLREESGGRSGRTLVISAETGAIVDSTLSWGEVFEIAGPGSLHVEPAPAADAPN
jgi:hypothetical protein